MHKFHDTIYSEIHNQILNINIAPSTVLSEVYNTVVHFISDHSFPKGIIEMQLGLELLIIQQSVKHTREF